MDLSGGREQIDPAPINFPKVYSAVLEIAELVTLDEEDYSEQKAWVIYNRLTNDEKINVQTILKLGKPAGTRKTFWSCFYDHLKLEREWRNENN